MVIYQQGTSVISKKRVIFHKLYFRVVASTINKAGDMVYKS